MNYEDMTAEELAALPYSEQRKITDIPTLERALTGLRARLEQTQRDSRLLRAKPKGPGDGSMNEPGDRNAG